MQGHRKWRLINQFYSVANCSIEFVGERILNNRFPMQKNEFVAHKSPRESTIINSVEINVKKRSQLNESAARCAQRQDAVRQCSSVPVRNEQQVFAKQEPTGSSDEGDVAEMFEFLKWQ